MRSHEPEQATDLELCSQEPIHIPSAIQPHGVLLALSEPDLVVRQVSDNVAALLGVSTASVLERPLTDLLDQGSFDRLRAALAGPGLEYANPMLLVACDRAFDGICHRYLNATILELEPVRSPPASLRRPLRAALAALQARDSVAGLCAAAVDVVRELTGFDRVMIYRFDASDNGQVIAESVDAPRDRYLGLHYPASDIPRQARELYLRNWIRAIPDARYSPAPLVPGLRPETGKPLDLSHAALRSVSPIHLEYMRNMGTAASMSVSLIVHERLWGLIACLNHEGPLHLAYEQRAACEVVGRLMSLQLSALEDLQLRAFRAERETLLQSLDAAMRGGKGDVLSALLFEPAALLELVNASGAAIVTGEDCTGVVGEQPGEAAIRELSIELAKSSPADVLSYTCLTDTIPHAATWRAKACGVLSFVLPGSPSRRLLWFRPEVVRTVDWAGAPTKTLGGEAEPRIHPRRSFELWKESVSLRSLPWLPGELDVARELRRRALEIDLAMQVEREQRAVRARDDLVAVVSHDLKNPLMVVQMQSSLLLRGLGGGEESSRRLRASAERIQRAVDRMNALIHNLLDLAKIEAGRFEVNAKPSDPALILEEALLVMSPLAERKTINLTVDAEPAPDVLADRDRVYQVLSNLISNAIKFTPEGGDIRLCTRTDAGAVIFSVVDQGGGIPPDQLPRVFDRFWQASRTRRQGSGLGLYIVKGIVEAHHGRLWAESTVGVGSTFHFTLPAVRT